VAQRFTAAITGLFAVPASQAAERLTEGQPTSAVQRAKLAETQAGRGRPKAEFQTISYSNEFPRHPKSSERSVVHIRIRLAENHDVPVLREWIAASVWGLQAGDYSTAQLEHAVQVLLQELFCLIFEFLEHHAVAILGMTGYDASLV
jgi:hypothetical protein